MFPVIHHEVLIALTRFAICLFVAATVGRGASFDCAKARTPQEKAICASPKLSAADDQMAAAYRAILRAAPPEMTSEIRQSQLTWIHKRATQCSPSGPDAATDLETCLLADENARAIALNQMIHKEAGVTFIWHYIYRKTSGGEDPNAVNNNGPEGPGSLEASWPRAMSNTSEWNAWNQAIESATHKIAEQSNVDSAGPAPREWKAVDGADVDVSVSIDFAGSELVTSTITNYWDGHGAHPNTDTVQFDWILKQQRLVRPEDVFRADSDWNTVLYNLCDRYLHKTLDHEFGGDYTTFSAPGTITTRVHAIAADPQSWRIDDKGLTLVFQPYAVACYACTPDPFTIPWTELKPLLNPGFAVPKRD